MQIKKKLIFGFLFSFLFSYSQHDSFKQGISYYEEENYSAAQSIFENIESDEALFFSAECSKILSLNDAKYKFYKHLLEYPNSSSRSKSNLGLAQIFYRENNYKKTIECYLNVEKSDFTYEHTFKLGYSYFMLDFFDEASYYFSQLTSRESKYASVAQYYYAHIAYQQGFYKRALSGFNKLRFSEKFSNIIPYYITQIYFFQKRYQDLIDYTELIIDNVIASRKSEVHRLIAESYYHLANYTKSIYHFEIFISETENLKTIDYFQLGHTYFNVNDYLNAIKYLEKVSSNEEKIQQLVAYYLGASYIKLDYKNYALNSFKKASEYESNSILQEDAFFNYIKLSFELNSPFDNTIELINKYLNTYKNSEKKTHIESLMIQAWQGKFEYKQTYIALKEKPLLSAEDQIHFQKVSFFLGVKSYNEEDFKSAILLFEESNKYPSNERIYFMSSFWLADCYYQLQDYQESIIKHNLIPNYIDEAINYYQDLRKYNQAYCYFYLKKYRESNQLFRNYLKNSNDSMRINDVYLRLGDGLFIENEFLLASEYYKKAIQFNLFDTDYALYNQSLCFGLLNQSKNKLKSLEELIKNYKSSIYYDDALLSLANHYAETFTLSLSIPYYDSLLNHTSNYEMQAKAYLSKGMLYLRNKESTNAIEMFNIILQKYNASKYFKESISGLQAAYTNVGEIEKYLEIISELPQINISKSQKDSLTYQAAFSKFIEGDFKTANKVFQSYLTNFPDGIFVPTVHFYSAQTAISLQDTSLALMHHNFIVESSNQMYLEKSLIFLSRYYYSKNDFPNGNMYYMGLEKIASTNSVKREAVLRLMYLNESKNLQVAVDYAKKVLNLEKVDNWQLTKAHIIIARNDFKEGNYYRAKKSFKKIISLSQNDAASEAFYMLIYLTYLEEDYQKTEEMVFEMAGKYNNNYFLAKSFLILADVYKIQEKKFQAKVTLESIIDSNIEEEIVNQARRKWEEIIQEETESINIPIINEQSYIDILEEDIDYELIFNEDTIE